MVYTTKSPKNDIGLLYADASTTKKLAFRLALLQAGERDNASYMKRFRDFWQYQDSVGSMPYCMVIAAIDHLGYSVNQKQTQHQLTA